MLLMYAPPCSIVRRAADRLAASFVAAITSTRESPSPESAINENLWLGTSAKISVNASSVRLSIAAPKKAAVACCAEWRPSELWTS